MSQGQAQVASEGRQDRADDRAGVLVRPGMTVVSFADAGGDDVFVQALGPDPDVITQQQRRSSIRP